MYKYLLCDIDGILLDSYWSTYEAYNLAFNSVADFQLSIEEFDKNIWNKNWVVARESYMEMDTNKIHYEKKMYFELVDCGIYEGNVSMLKTWLDAGCATVVTGSSTAEKKLKYLGLTGSPFIQGVNKNTTIGINKILDKLSKEIKDCCLYDDCIGATSLFRSLGGWSILGPDLKPTTHKRR